MAEDLFGGHVPDYKAWRRDVGCFHCLGPVLFNIFPSDFLSRVRHYADYGKLCLVLPPCICESVLTLRACGVGVMLVGVDLDDCGKAKTLGDFPEREISSLFSVPLLDLGV